MYGGAKTVVLPREQRFKIDDNVSLPLFGDINLHLPEFFVIKMKKGYKLISPTTKTGAITSRNGKKAFKIIKNEKNELFLHEPSFPQIHFNEFSKKDRDIIEKYFHKIPSQHSSSLHSKSKSSKSKHSFVAPSFIVPATGSLVSSLSSDRTMELGPNVILPSGKKKYNLYKTQQEKKEMKMMASQDTRRIARLARIASKKQGKGARKTRRNRRI